MFRGLFLRRCTRAGALIMAQADKRLRRIEVPSRSRDQLEVPFEPTYFDDSAKYSDSSLNQVLGQADRVILHVVVLDSGGTYPTLSVHAEDSSDNLDWTEVGAPLVDAESVTTTPALFRAVVPHPHAGFLRFRVEMGGTNPQSFLLVRATLKFR